ncbi:MAG: hypothetical protein EBX40_01310, partial [Gammaproteobacteria bacterium]|nr:hypothetical protein [Gammaproteobacteria bacterium]
STEKNDTPSSQLFLDVYAGTQTLSQMLEDVDEQGDTPLHHACRHANTEVASELLQKGASRTAKNHSNQTPILVAAHHQAWNVVALFAKYKIHSKSNDSELYGEALKLAAQFEKTDLCLSLLEAGAPLLLTQNTDSALHHAARHGNLKLIQSFLEKRPSAAFAQNAQGKIPGLIAAEAHQWEAVKALTHQCAEESAIQMQYGHILLCTSRANQPKIASHLIRKKASLQLPARYSSVHFATAYQNLKLLLLLLKKGASPNGEHFPNPVIIAVFLNNPKILTCLYAYGAHIDPNTLRKAIETHRWASVEAFIDYAKKNSSRADVFAATQVLREHSQELPALLYSKASRIRHTQIELFTPLLSEFPETAHPELSALQTTPPSLEAFLEKARLRTQHHPLSKEHTFWQLRGAALANISLFLQSEECHPPHREKQIQTFEKVDALALSLMKLPEWALKPATKVVCGQIFKSIQKAYANFPTPENTDLYSTLLTEIKSQRKNCLPTQTSLSFCQPKNTLAREIDTAIILSVLEI